MRHEHRSNRAVDRGDCGRAAYRVDCVESDPAWEREYVTEHTYISLDEFRASGRDKWDLAENEWIVHDVPYERLDHDERVFEGRDATVTLFARTMPGPIGPVETKRRILHSFERMKAKMHYWDTGEIT
jgi:hypothetical protein